MKPEDIRWLDEEDSEQPIEEPTPAEETPAEEPPQRKPRKQRSFSWIFVVGALLIGVIVMFVTGGFKKLFGGDKGQTLRPVSDQILYTTDSVTRVRPFADMALHMSANGLRAYATNGSLVWDQPFTMNYPSLVTNERCAIVADLGGTQILLFDETGLLNTITTEASILYCTVNRNGFTAAILDSGASHTLVVFDQFGRTLVRRITYADQDGVPMAIAINDDATCMATAYMIYTEAELRSAVTLFNLTDSASDSIDRIAGNYTYTNTLISDLYYMGDELIAVGDNRVVGIRSSGNTAEDWNMELSYEITALGVGSDFIALLQGEGLVGVAGASEHDMLVIGVDGKRRLELNMEDSRGLWVQGDVIVYQDGFDYIALDRAGDTIWSYNAENAMQLYPMGEKAALGNTGGAMQFFTTASGGA